jgi:hypothetical protein
MQLRPITSFSLSLPGGLKLPVALAVAALLVLAPLAARANAAAGDFPSPLYLSGAQSSVVTVVPAGSKGSRVLVAGAGIGGGLAAPTAALAQNGTIPTSNSFTYAYTLVDAAGETAPSPTSNSVTTVAGWQQMQLTLPAGLPANVNVRIYRKRSAHFYFLTEVPSSTTSIIDNAAEPPSTTILPQAQNRVGFALGACNATNCGYSEFQPGTPVTNFSPTPLSSASSPALSSSASTTPSNKGWLVDVPGPVKFQAGTWTFRLQYKSGIHTSGIAHLVVGLWKVTVSGGAVSSSTLLVDPNGAGEQTATNLINNLNIVQTVVHSVTLPTVSLATGEYLYVQFWRRQTTPYALALSADARTITLYANDGFGRIEHPAADDAAPNAFSITAPASGDFIKNGYSLKSNATDPTPGSGIASVDYYYCLPLDDCSLPANRFVIGSSSTPSDYAFAWSGQPVDGTYQLFAKATDNVLNTTETAVVPITIDNTPPDTSLTSTPADPSNGSPSFSFSSGEPGTFECSLDGAPFAACSSPDALSGLSTGSHTFQVRAVDRAANVDATAASHTWTVDATTPTVTFSSTPTNPSASAAASFSFNASEPATFQCGLDGGAFAACTSPRSLSGLADGSHTYEVRATDGVGNVGSAAHTWTIDTATPVVSFGSTPANPTNSTAASFAFSANEPATIECRLDGAAYGACPSPHSVRGLADGSHTFDVKATDAVGHVGTASFSWTVDTFAPSAPSLEGPGLAAPTRSLRVTAVYTGPESGAAGRVEFRVCSDAACVNVVAAGASADVAKGATAAWTINVALADGTYFWQARAIDLAGNASGWTNVWSFTRDTVSPAAPGGFVGVVAADGLTLRWTSPPGGDIGNYVVYVDGKQWRVLGEVTYEVKLGPFDAGDTRSFTVSAIDRAGNEGPQTTPLVGVPDVVGLSLAAAKDAVETRGLVLDDVRAVQTEGTPAFVVAQTPPAPALAAKGSEVEVLLGSGPDTANGPLVQIDSGRVCGTGGFLKLQVRLRERAKVNLSVFDARNKRLAFRRLGSRPPGLTNHNLHLPKALGRPGRYRLVVTAKASNRTGRDTMRITVKRPNRGSGARAGC